MENFKCCCVLHFDESKYRTNLKLFALQIQQKSDSETELMRKWINVYFPGLARKTEDSSLKKMLNVEILKL